MKVVHIGANTTGGAGLGMMGVHRALLSAGIDSRVVTLRVNPGEENLPEITVLPPVSFDDPVGDVVQKLRKQYRIPVSSPYAGVRLEELDVVKDADIIHFHWVTGLVDLPTFFPKINKPVVWTIRDENAMLGLYHFDRERPVTPTEDEQRVDDELRDVKTQAINACRDLTFVSLCDGMKARLDASAIGGRESFVIPNRIDTDCFYPRPREKVRGELQIADNEIVILFAVQFQGEKRKGLQELFDALGRLVSDTRRFIVVCVGHGKVEATASQGVRVVCPGATADPERMAEFYSAADLFVTPSYSETFGKTTAEAIACGTPVVSFPNMGAKDIIRDGVDGFLADGFNPLALARAIDKALKTDFNRERMITGIRERYSPDHIAGLHLELYRHIIATPPAKRERAPAKCLAMPTRTSRVPRLSIITICYNNADDLRKTLWSTLHEQYGFDDFEQIVVDGGSQDGTARVLEEYKDRLGWYCSEPDRGIYDAMNKGAEHARGEYLLFLNSGDVLLTDMLKEVMGNPFSEDLVYSDIYFRTGDCLSVNIAPSMDEMTPGWFLFNSLPHQATFIRRDLHNRIGGYDASMKISAAPKFIFKALFELHCSYRKLDFAFSVFDRSGISSQPRMLRPKLNEWMDFLSPYFGKRVAGIAMRYLTVREVLDWEVYEYLRWHPREFESLRTHIKQFISVRRCHGKTKASESLKKLSIITIVLNDKEGLKRTLESVFESQPGFPDFEQIVVDGGSSDGTTGVIGRYADRITWWCSEPDKGIYNAMNKGAAHACGEYLLFLNAGDVLLEDSLKDVFAHSFGEDLVYGDIYKRDADGEARLVKSPSSRELTPAYLTINTLPHQATLIRRQLHNDLGGYDETMKISAAPKFISDALLKRHCTHRHLALAFSVFDCTGISCDNHYLPARLREWQSFLAVHFGKRVANSFYRAKMSREVVSGKVIAYIAKHPEKIGEVRQLVDDGVRRLKSGRRGRDGSVAALKSELKSIKGSFAYRVGMMATWPARRVYRGMRCLRKNGLRYTLRRFFLGKNQGKK